jgi:CheY-like chemotaxis protein
MDGTIATKTIRATLPHPAKNVKIIAMTANVLQEDIKSYLDCGMDTYVSKPFLQQELLTRMHEVTCEMDTFCRGAAGSIAPTTVDITPKAEHVSATSTVAQGVGPITEEVTNMLFIKQFTGGNPDKMRKYLNMFLENAPKLLTQLENGLQTKDYGMIKIAAHSFKPQLTYMGVKEEMSKIATIEHAADAKADFAEIGAMLANLRAVCQKAFEEVSAQIE